MLKNVQEIVPSVGLGGIKFGMTRDEVKVVIGPPDDIENLPGFEEEVNDQLESWHYDEYEFSLVFDAIYDWKLVSIAVSDPYFTLFGEHIIDMDKQDALDILEKNNIVITHVEDVSDDENPDLILMESEDAGLMIWFQDDIAIEIQFLPEVEDDGETLIWPI
ncbi:MAG TPA: hypothetical protein PK047_04715 [Saprospiraceae bacterium]|mgnify:FL=1|nr:hypothetical protein [Saprospiraceae bacterium]HRO08146.1 hypothetical protein [Saprospiraceae bacterium]HRP41539.1 hypothetical protein [Saprospiraceae bacterium]